MTRPLPDLQLSVFTRLSEAEPDWQQLKDAHRGNPYQSAEWLEAWVDTLGRDLKVAPLIAVGRLEGRAVVLLPLGLETSAGFTTLSFLGHQHGNQNTGIWDPDFYRAATPGQIAAFLRALCDRSGADLLKLENVPHSWLGRDHPLVLEGATLSPSPVFARSLGTDFDTLFKEGHSKSARKNLLRKERHLQAAGDYRVARAEGTEERGRAMTAFLEQRALRALEAGIPNVFDTPSARTFLARMLGLDHETAAGRKPLMDLWYLETGGAIRATCLCIDQGGTRYAYTNSVAHDDMLANSPGLVLIKEIVAQACAEPGLDRLDLGLGEERYKTAWADPVALRDSLLAATFRGGVKLQADKARIQAKAAIRNSALLWPLVRRLRKWKAGLSGRR